MSFRFVAALAMTGAVVGACVIADPRSDDDATQATASVGINRYQSVPSPNGVLTRWPDSFKVVVELSDSRQTFFASSFVDFNPLTGEGFQNDTKTSTPSSGSSSATRLVEFVITPPSADRCHMIEIVVASSFFPNPAFNQVLAHTPSNPGDGDTITWFYSPNGDSLGCPLVDAGLVPDAAALDADASGASP